MTKIKESRDSKGEILHYGIGAVIENEKGEYLLIDRAVEPFGFGCISGHINEGEEAIDALKREVKEEAGLDVVNYKLIYGRKLRTRGCSYGKIPHYCFIFKCDVGGKINGNPKEVKSINWYSKEEIKNLKLEPLWKFFFKKEKVI